MSLTPYRHLLAVRDVRRLLLFGVVARVPHTAAGIALTLHVVNGLDRGYTAAGVVAAVMTVGMALGAPWRGRAVDRLGLRRALLPSLVAEALVWTSAPFLPYEGLLVVAFVGGLMGLPIFTVIRQSLSILVPASQRRTAYAVDSMGVELSFMTGPAIGVLVSTWVSSGAALVLVGVTTVVAGLGLYRFNPPTRSEQLRGHRVGPSVDTAEAAAGYAPERPGAQRPGAERPGADWARSPALLAVLATTFGATLVLAGSDVGVVAVLREHGAETLIGLVFLFWGAGSIAGALVHGQAHRTVHPLWLLLALGVLTVPVGLAGSPLLLCLAILPAGALCAPVISSTAEAVARLVPEESRGTAMGWHGSSLTVGSALGAPVAGAAIDGVAPWAGFAVVGLAGVVVAVVGLSVQLLRRRPVGPAGSAAPEPAAVAAG